MTERIQDNGPQWQRTKALAAKCGLTFTVVETDEDIPSRWRSDYLDDVGYSPGRKTIFLSRLKEPLIGGMHEVCHWLVATPRERRLVNWGFETPPLARRTPDERELQACQVTVGIAYLWGYEHEARELVNTLNVWDDLLPQASQAEPQEGVLRCVPIAEEYLRKNNIALDA